MPYVIACGDEGVQLNEGTRLGFVGAGFRLEGFSEVVKHLKNVLGEDICIAASEESAWMKEQLDLSTWEQVNASAQQRIEALSDKEGLPYAGMIPFADPKELECGIKAHMVRPHDIHIANKIKFTLGGGEQTYNLGYFVISADWVSVADDELVVKVIAPQIAFYKKLVNATEMSFDFETEGALGEEIAHQNKEKLLNLGLVK